MAKIILITHGDCPDGMACAVIAKKIDADAEILHGAYPQVGETAIAAAKRLKEGGRLIISDICPDEEVLNQISFLLTEKKASLEIYEHHKTRSWLSSFQPQSACQFTCVFDNSRCGSKIFFDSQKEKYPQLHDYSEFIRLTNDRDLWLNQDPASLELNRLHAVLQDAEYVKRFVSNSSPLLTHDEKILVDYLKKNEERRMAKILGEMEVFTDSEGRKYAIAWGEGEASELLHRALERHGASYAILANLNNGKASVRGHGDFDCAAWAEQFGGGGHKGAAGFKIKFTKPKIV